MKKSFSNKSNSNRHAKPSSKSHAKPRSSHAGSSSGASRDSRSSKPMQVTVPRSWRQITGTHAVLEALRVHPRSIKQAFIQKTLLSSPDIKAVIDLLRTNSVSFEEKAEADLSKICPSHQGVVVFSDYNPSFDYTVAEWEQKSMILALDGVEDPHNLGAILRTSWLMGVHGLIIPQDRAVGLTATVHKVACGGAEHVSLARINNFTEPFEALKQAGFWVYGLSHKATKTIHDIEYPEKVVWVLGAEDKGLRTTTERLCDELVSIPQASAEASYNVSVATAIALSETKRQWMKSQK